MSMDTPIFEEALYGSAYDTRENSNSTDINVPCLSEDDTPHVEQEKESEDAIQKKDDATVPDHTGIPMEEIPYVGLRFDSLQQAQEFYSNYAKKVGFVTRIRNTNFDKTRKELKVPINQSIHYSREGYRESRVKAAMQVKRITTAGCKARMYVMLDRHNDNWLVTKLELKHTHACSAEQAVHYSEYRKLTMHAKCVIQNNDEAGIRPNKTYLALANEIGGSSKLGYSEKDVRNFITRNLRCADGDLFRVTVNEQYLLYGEPRSWKYSVEFDPKTHKVRCECNMFGSRGIICCHCLAVLFYYGVDTVPSFYVIPRWSKNVQQKHTFIKSSHDEKRSDESHNLFRRLCSHFYNVAQDFVTCEEEAAMLHLGLDQLRSKLLDCRVNLVSRRVPSSQNIMVTQGDPHLGESYIQGPSKVSTKGRPRMKRLGSELDASIKNSMRRKKKNPPLDVHQALNQDVVCCFARRANGSQEHGGFLSLLNSFQPT
ncbi:hypothetical protein Ahy_Scaffold6g108041 [Arachis hypogaea]|uniref:SWIM-type domain-containing protein n=1 Tax=Arachis hypogaea TaxID=3818 RepID=A0A444WP78_ARAHY|nr:hypothetical protein Ahy_Scaffold6g108041 [Arachis hypogaea]